MEDSAGMSGFCIKAGGNNTSTNNNVVVRGGTNHGSSTGNKCGRWNPTTEQVKVLTDLFRAGLRTPSTDQIQKISTQLSFYGKIESKNVFYWFQNHKARERQKRRKVSVDQDDDSKDNFFLKEDKIPSPKHFAEIYHHRRRHHRHEEHQVSEPERVIETLQLFPLNSFGDQADNSEKIRRFHASEYYCKEAAAFPYTIETEMDHPPLDLRLSFI